MEIDGEEFSSLFDSNKILIAILKKQASVCNECASEVVAHTFHGRLHLCLISSSSVESDKIRLLDNADTAKSTKNITV